MKMVVSGRCTPQECRAMIVESRCLCQWLLNVLGLEGSICIMCLLSSPAYHIRASYVSKDKSCPRMPRNAQECPKIVGNDQQQHFHFHEFTQKGNNSIWNLCHPREEIQPSVDSITVTRDPSCRVDCAFKVEQRRLLRLHPSNQHHS